MTKKMDMVDQIIALETGEGIDEVDQVEFYQGIIDSGMAWQLQGSYGRAAMDMIEAGLCILGEESHRDCYGNRIPSRYEVKPGTKGSPEYVKQMTALYEGEGIC